jgi:hypothetical protein
MFEIVAIIDGFGRIDFIKVEKERVEEFVRKEAEKGNLVSVIANGDVKKLASREVIEFEIEENI